MEQMISPVPDIRTHEINPSTDPWMILACDGIWNFMSSQEVVDWVEERIKDVPDDKLSQICEELFEHCLAPDTLGDGTGCDNMTAIIVRFKPSLATRKDVIQAPETTSSLSSSGEAGSSSGGAASSSSSKEAQGSSVASSAGSSSGEALRGSSKRVQEDSEEAPASKRAKLESSSCEASSSSSEASTSNTEASTSSTQSQAAGSSSEAV
jgi:protein phosphatase 1G